MDWNITSEDSAAFCSYTKLTSMWRGRYKLTLSSARFLSGLFILKIQFSLSEDNFSININYIWLGLSTEQKVEREAEHSTWGGGSLLDPLVGMRAKGDNASPLDLFKLQLWICDHSSHAQRRLSPGPGIAVCTPEGFLLVLFWQQVAWRCQFST